MKQLHKKIVQWAVVSLLTASATAIASDIEIYQIPSTSNKIYAMLTIDTSGSMGSDGWGGKQWSWKYNNATNGYYYTTTPDSIWEDYAAKWWNSSTTDYAAAKCIGLSNRYQASSPDWVIATARANATVVKRYLKKVGDPSQNLTSTDFPNGVYFEETYCFSSVKNANGELERVPDRLTRVKEGLFRVLENEKLVEDLRKQGVQLYLGLGQYSTQFNSSETAITADSTTGSMRIPAAALDDAQRLKLAAAIAKLIPYAGTPSAPAYAESAAYLFGNATSGTGSGFANSSSTTKTGTKYTGVLMDQCSKQGIYLLTDGAPNSGTSASALMKQTATTGFSCTDADTGWDCMIKFEAWLRKSASGTYKTTGRNAVNNVLTATVGFAGIFEKVDLATCGDRKSTDPATTDAKNLCLLGQPDSGKTKSAGFFYAADSEKVVDSVRGFIANLSKGTPPLPLPGATITIPQDPYNFFKNYSAGFMPLVQPSDQPNKKIWNGNLKKYQAREVYYGAPPDDPTSETRFGNKLFTANGYTDINTVDMWTKPQAGPEYKYNGAFIEIGGALDQLPVPYVKADKTIDYTSRSVFTDKDVASGALLPLPKADSSSKFKNAYLFLSAADALTTDKGLITFSLLERINMLNYLGFKINPADYSSKTTPTGKLERNETFTSTERTAILTAIKNSAADDVALQRFVSDVEHTTMGAILHSKPVLVSYRAKLKSTGELEDASATSRDQDMILFGSSEGGLHMVRASDGVEQFVFVPSDLIKSTAQPLVSDALRKGSLGTFSYGVDAPWTVDIRYKKDGDYLKADRVRAYGGLRMGGIGFYGLDLTDYTAPKLLFKFTDKTAGFERLGQTWSTPVAARVNYPDASGKLEVKDVLFITGGYDAQYESALFIPTSLLPAKGNTVFMIDAATGTKLWSAVEVSKGNGKSAMFGSITGRVNAVDRNSDGLVDHIWFGDLQGSIFRASFDNKATTQAAFSVGVDKIGEFPGYRFGGRVVVTRQTIRSGKTATTKIMVVAGSGDETRPLRTTGSTNAIFAFYEDDAFVSAGWLSYLNGSTYKAPAKIATSSATASTTTYTRLKANPTTVADAKSGWYMSVPVSSADGTVAAASNGGAKVLDGLLAVSGKVFYNVFDPTVNNPNAIGAIDGGVSSGDGCSFNILGASTLRQICLPYGKKCIDNRKYSVNSVNPGNPGDPSDPSNPSAGEAATQDLIQLPNQQCVGLCEGDIQESITHNLQNTYETGVVVVQKAALKPLQWLVKQPNSK